MSVWWCGLLPMSLTVHSLRYKNLCKMYPNTFFSEAWQPCTKDPSGSLILGLFWAPHCSTSINVFELSIYLSSINHEPSILTMRRDGQKRKNNKENVHLTAKKKKKKKKKTTQCRIKTVWCCISM